MSARPRVFLALLAVIGAALLAAAPAPVANGQMPPAGGPLAVALLVDNSGSMAASDKDGLRWSAAQLFVDLASPGDRLAVATFSDDVQPLGAAANGDLDSVSDRASRESIKALLAPRAPAGATNMNDALRTAARLLEHEAPAARPVIVLLTDGKPEPSSQIPALNEIIVELGRRGVLTFPILLGGNVDPDSANRMTQATGSLRQDVANASGLLEAFGRIYAYVQPDRYVDELTLTPGQRIAFQTNPAQSATDVAVIVPRVEKDGAGLKDATLGGANLLDQSVLANGERSEEAEGPHYQLVRVTHNAPITGEWALNSAAHGKGLLIVSSHVVFEVPHPVASVANSFVSPRYIPAGRPLFLAAQVRRAGNLVADAQLAVVADQQVTPLETKGMSSNRDMYWKFIALPGLPANGSKKLELQVGNELAPFRLRKSFVVSAIDAPPLVVDSPTPGDNGLRPGSRLGLAAHFGAGATDAKVTAYVYDERDGTVAQTPLTCSGAACSDERLVVEPGRAYSVLFVGEAMFKGSPYSDAQQSGFATGDVVRIDGLDRAAQLGTLLPDSPAPSVPITVTAFVQSGAPKLTVRLARINPPLPASFAGQAVALLSPLVPAGSNTYHAELTFRGLETLPPNDYTAELQFESDGGLQISPSTGQVAFRVPKAGLSVDGLAELAAIREVLPGVAPRSLSLTVTTYAVTGAPQLTARLINLTPAAPPGLTVAASLSTLSPTEKGRYVTQLTLTGLERLPANDYTADVLLESPVAPVSPALTQITFRVAEAAASLLRVTSPAESEVCPQDVGLARPRNQIDFGVLQGEIRSLQVDLYFAGSSLPPGPFQMAVDADPMRRLGNNQASGNQSRFTLGAAERTTDGSLRVPLRLELPPDLPPGRYVETIRLSSPQAAVDPQVYDVMLYRPNFFGNVAYATLPVRCLARDYYALVPGFPRIKGVISWAVSLLALALLVTFIRSAMGIEPASFQVTGPDGEGVPLPGGREGYVVVGEDGQTRVTTNNRDAGAAIVTLVTQPGDLEEVQQVQLMPGPHAGDATVSYYSPRKLKWLKLTPKGRRMEGGDQFRVRIGSQRNEYTIEALM